MKVPAVCNLKKDIKHVVSEKVEPGERALFGIDKAVTDDLVESQEQRGQHLLSIFCRIGAVAVEHKDVGLLDHLEGFDNGIPFSFARLRPDGGAGLAGILYRIIGTFGVDNQDMVISEVLEIADDNAYSWRFVERRD